jgi:hypothetical protein
MLYGQHAAEMFSILLLSSNRGHRQNRLVSVCILQLSLMLVFGKHHLIFAYENRPQYIVFSA